MHNSFFFKKNGKIARTIPSFSKKMARLHAQFLLFQKKWQDCTHNSYFFRKRSKIARTIPIFIIKRRNISRAIPSWLSKRAKFIKTP